MKNKNNVAYIFLFLATLFWSGNFLVGKFASQYQIPPFSLQMMEMVFCLVNLSTIYNSRNIKKKKLYIRKL